MSKAILVFLIVAAFLAISGAAHQSEAAPQSGGAHQSEAASYSGGAPLSRAASRDKAAPQKGEIKPKIGDRKYFEPPGTKPANVKHCSVLIYKRSRENGGFLLRQNPFSRTGVIEWMPVDDQLDDQNAVPDYALALAVVKKMTDYVENQLIPLNGGNELDCVLGKGVEVHVFLVELKSDSLGAFPEPRTGLGWQWLKPNDSRIDIKKALIAMAMGLINPPESKKLFGLKIF